MAIRQDIDCCNVAGVGRAEGGLEAALKGASRPDALQRWRRATTVIIDEV